jgi:hypothetical protein
MGGLRGQGSSGRTLRHYANYKGYNAAELAFHGHYR